MRLSIVFSFDMPRRTGRCAALSFTFIDFSFFSADTRALGLLGCSPTAAVPAAAAGLGAGGGATADGFWPKQAQRPDGGAASGSSGAADMSWSKKAVIIVMSSVRSS